MEILLAYLAFAALILAITGLFIPRKIVFWCEPDDRDRAMAFTVYLALSIILSITFIVVVPEPQATPEKSQSNASSTDQVQLTGTMFIKEVKQRLPQNNDTKMREFEVFLLDFGRNGASCQLLYPSNPDKKDVTKHASLTVIAMVSIFKAHGWNVADPVLMECQVQTEKYRPTLSDPIYRIIGFARYEPETGKVVWKDLE
ncbi:hypothetical protein [Maridesulfovibrio hydrothermalis]|uniref:Uncharacterized protein n=1 Tax=Maridesulfovibrio hydrothermalis AM13 = DSM 14728 TaxID=1121451 RepID=L0RBK9_9BACT|nr:hypothetical protein [Maridesulfovibrio hydrothermalis]CCO24149.1 protein of unknown function [Maridesulfovibrio hydrothermalis AM13 = DSM 14728]